jgi:hypothetical protein
VSSATFRPADEFERFGSVLPLLAEVDLVGQEASDLCIERNHGARPRRISNVSFEDLRAILLAESFSRYLSKAFGEYCLPTSSKNSRRALSELRIGSFPFFERLREGSEELLFAFEELPFAG